MGRVCSRSWSRHNHWLQHSELRYALPHQPGQHAQSQGKKLDLFFGILALKSYNFSFSKLNVLFRYKSSVWYVMIRVYKFCFQNFTFLGRIKDKQSVIREKIIQSKQMGKRENKDINIEGRVQFDLLMVGRWWVLIILWKGIRI